MWSFQRYVALSTMAAAAVIYHAFYTREQYFSSLVYLSTSKLSVAVLGNMAFACALCIYRFLIKLFLGSLRDAEVERLNERVSSAVMETCLAMTIFREEFRVAFVVMFATVTFVKIFHWLVQDRVEYVEITPHISRLQHLRIVSFMALLLAVDIQFLNFTVHKVIQSNGHTVMLLFAFEYLIQISAIFSSIVKYAFHAVDSMLEGRWESRGIYVFYLELLTDLIHLCVYLIFFGIVLMQYGLPIHLIRELYWTIRNFRNRVRDFLRYRRVTSRMDLFPDADEADLVRCDNVCIICREEMTMATVNKKLPCGHVFHVHCLRSWLERQQSCPICRNPVFPPREPDPPQAADHGPQAEPHADHVQDVPALLQDLHNVEFPPPANEPHPEAQVPPERGARVDDPLQQPIPGPSDLPQAGQQPVPLQPRLPLQWNGQPLGVMWNYPNVLPITSMATFVNGQFQYAGQQNPEPVMNQQGLTSVPFVPVISSFSAPITLMTPPGSSPERPRMAAAAAVAAAAYSPYTGLVMMPPVTYIPQSGSSSSARNGGGTSTSAAQAAAAASAASGVAAAFSGTPPFNTGEQPSIEATIESVQRQLEFLNAQVARGEGSSSQTAPETQSTAQEDGPSSSSMTAPPLANEELAANEEIGRDPLSSLPVAAEATTSQPPVQDVPPADSRGPSTAELRERRVQRLEQREERDQP